MHRNCSIHFTYTYYFYGYILHTLLLIWITLLYLMSTIDSDWTIRTTQWAQLEVGNISSLCPSLVTPSAWKPWHIVKAPLRENTSNGEICNLNFAFIWHTPNHAIPLLENFQRFLFLAEWSSHSFACDLRFSPTSYLPTASALPSGELPQGPPP